MICTIREMDYTLIVERGEQGLVFRSEQKKPCAKSPTLTTLVSDPKHFQRIEELESKLKLPYFREGLYLGNGHSMELSKMFGTDSVRIVHFTPGQGMTSLSVAYDVPLSKLAGIVQTAKDYAGVLD